MMLAVLDDDVVHNEMMQGLLSAPGRACNVFSKPQALIRYCQRETVDLVVLDWNMPSMSGLEVLDWVRGNLDPNLPVLLVTSRSDSIDVVKALGAGADDYVVKPIQPDILKARVDALLRRAYPPPSVGAIETFGLHSFDVDQAQASIDGEAVALTNKEFQLALLLFRNLSRPLSRGYLLETVWGQRPDVETRTLDAHISRVRRKLALRPDNGLRLSTIYGYGYRLERCEVGADSDPE